MGMTRIFERSTTRRVAQLLVAVVGVLLSVSPTFADMITFGIYTANVPGFTGPYATVNINRTSSTMATVTFTSDTNGGYIYLMGGMGAVALNVNGSFAVGPVTETQLAGFTAPSISIGSGNEDGFGSFNLLVTNSDGFTRSATSISFTLTKSSGSWSSALDVLTPNSHVAEAGIHAFACAEPGCSPSSTGPDGGPIPTFFTAHIPEPSTLMLLGSGLVGFAYLAVRRRRGSAS
jgi:hypothetical protein